MVQLVVLEKMQNRDYFKMDIISASKARANLFSLLEKVNKHHQPQIITSKKGDAVLIAKEDWESLQETLYLQAIPGLVDSVKKAEKDDNWVDEEEFLKALDVDN